MRLINVHIFIRICHTYWSVCDHQQAKLKINNTIDKTFFLPLNCKNYVRIELSRSFLYACFMLN